MEIRRQYPDAPVAAVAVIVVAGGQVLLVRRRNPPHAGAWSIPGGVQELGEHVVEAARREVREETGLAVRDLRLLDVGDMLEEDSQANLLYHYVIVYYCARLDGGEIKAGDDVTDVRWVLVEDAGALGVSARLMALLQRAMGCM